MRQSQSRQPPDATPTAGTPRRPLSWMVANDAASKDEPHDPDAGESWQGKCRDDRPQPVGALAALGNAYGMNTTTGAIHTPEARKNSRSVNIKRAPVPATITPTIDAVTKTAREPRKTGSLAGELDDDRSHEGPEAPRGEERSARGSR